MRRNVVLIDYESVQPQSLELLAGEHFHVCVFVGANQKKLPIEIVEALHRMGSRAEYIRITGSGPNALDFHIAFYMGCFSVDALPPYFHIISRDKGFDPLIEHLKSRRIFAARSESIEDIPIIKNGLRESPETRAAAYMNKLRTTNMTRPKSEPSLTRAIKSHFRDAVQDAEIAAIIRSMQKAGFIRVADNKVEYQPA